MASSDRPRDPRGPQVAVAVATQENVVKVRGSDIPSGALVRVLGVNKDRTLNVVFNPRNYHEEDVRRAQETDLEHYTEACRVALDILGELIPKVSPVEQSAIHARLGVIEDILDGAVTRYTD